MSLVSSIINISYSAAARNPEFKRQQIPLHSAFFDRLAQVAEGVALDPGARMPGQKTRLAEQVDVPDNLWETVTALAN